MLRTSSFFKFTKPSNSPITVTTNWSPISITSLPCTNGEILKQYMQDWLELRYHFLLIQKILLVFKRRSLSKAITTPLGTSLQETKKLLEEFEKNESDLEFKVYIEEFLNEYSEDLKWIDLFRFTHNIPVLKDFLLYFDALQCKLIRLLSPEHVQFIRDMIQTPVNVMILKIVLEHPDGLFRNNLDDLANAVDSSLVKDAILTFKNMPSSSKDMIYSLSRIIKKLPFEERLQIMNLKLEMIVNFFEIYDFFKKFYPVQNLLNAFVDLWLESSDLRSSVGFIIKNTSAESLKEMPFLRTKAGKILNNLQITLPALESLAEDKWQKLLAMQNEFPFLLKKEFDQIDWLDSSFPNLYSFDFQFKPNYVYQFDNQCSHDKQKNQFNLFLDRTENLIESEADFIHFYFKLLLEEEVMLDSNQKTEFFEIGIVLADDASPMDLDLNRFEYYSDIIHLSHSVSFLRNLNFLKNASRDTNHQNKGLVFG